MKIRRAFAEDAKGIQSVECQAFQACYSAYLPDAYLKSLPSNQEEIEKIRRTLLTHEAWVAEENKRIVGFSWIEPLEKEVFELVTIYIHPDFQKQGIGTALMEHVCQQKKKEGYQKVVLWTIKDGPSLGFYHKKGCVFSSVPEKLWRFDIPLVRLEKKL